MCVCSVGGVCGGVFTQMSRKGVKYKDREVSTAYVGYEWANAGKECKW